MLKKQKNQNEIHRFVLDKLYSNIHYCPIKLANRSLNLLKYSLLSSILE